MYMDENITVRCYTEYKREIYSLSEMVGENKRDEENILVKGCKKLKNNFYLVYPFYFASCFHDVDIENIYELTLCGNLYFSYLLSLDGLIDKHSGISFLILHKLHETALLKLMNIFPVSSEFWEYFKLYGREFVSGVLKEKELLNGPGINDYSYDSFRKITAAKCAVAKCATAGLNSLSGSKCDNESLNLSQEYFHIGLQIMDDIQDWHDDYLNKRNSFLINTVLSDKEFYRVFNQSREKPDLLGKYIYLSDTSYEFLKSAEENFRKALDACESFDLPFWKLLINEFKNKSELLISDFKLNKSILMKQYGARQRHYNHTSCGITLTENVPPDLKGIINKAMCYLMIERDNDYIEMLHVMRLPSSETKTNMNTSILVSGDVFQRTILVETYLSVNSIITMPEIKNIIREDILRILDSKMKNVGGGWNYFPGYPFLPPDSDDLAQVIRILVSANFDNLNVILDEHINLTVKYNRNPDGSLKTWILDPEDNGRYQKVLTAAVENYWGDYRGRDIEVTSNLLLSLLFYDRLKYSDVINKGVETVISAQNENGCWDSIWYWGPFYGTYISVRLLTEMKSGDVILKKTRDFLQSAQGPDGGWGINKSDPLNTSLSVLILKDIESMNMYVPNEVFNRALSYLTNEQESMGSWKKVNFIRMRLGETDRSYGSRTITSAFVLRALGRLLSAS